MKELLKKVKWDAILSSLLYVVLGIVTLIIPETMIKTLGYLIGILLILVGAVSMICYLLRDNSLNYYRHDFGYGLVGIAVGILFLYKVEWIISLVPVILGILVLASGCGKLQNVIDMKRAGYGNWAAMLILAVINVIFGVILIVNPFDTVILLFQLVGAGLIFSGVTDCITAVYVAGRLKKFVDRMEVVDSSFVEEIVKENNSRRGQEENGAEEARREDGAEKSDEETSEKVSDEGAEM
ncbi:DUF308 domain-containing protein [Acetatifactor muris]|jgi:uncharacterized membrane protein HdeD (DUF308 family)|uniref:Acid-resistance membrane protein n=1 Tax=Acetatifactor muris TaxID=879566 RepID=A0A2K4ZMR9_9FIRM|nr:DUF308 domain-containing protein [Acetatifactor muris]MCR2050123.1 DUF308 domain-containing protein [Acetatifactor muris]SOY31784.1 acid-resistance membrane protein [Acetatifactor muris]